MTQELSDFLAYSSAVVFVNFDIIVPLIKSVNYIQGNVEVTLHGKNSVSLKKANLE